MSDNINPAIFLYHGFCEGPYISQHFVQSLISAGFQTVEDPEQADILIGHSGGCFQIPTTSHARLVVYVGYPWWPGRSLINALYRKNRREHAVSRRKGTTRQWWKKFLWNSIYFWNMSRNFSMWQAMKRGPEALRYSRVLCIRNKDDDCCTSAIWKVPELKQCAFLSARGEHDHLWVHPDVYAVMIKAYYGAIILAQTETK